MDRRHEKGRSELSAIAEDFVPAVTPAPSAATPATNDASPASPGFAELADDIQRPRTPDPKDRRCWDWVAVQGNCHYARDREWFLWYRPLQYGTLISFCDHEPPATSVAGIGTVILTVQSRPEDGWPTYRLKLQNVLHVPNAPCNGFSPSQFHLRRGGTLLAGGLFAVDEKNMPWYYCVPFNGLAKLALVGDAQARSYIEGDGTAYCLDMVLSDREMAEIKYRPSRDESKPRFSAPGISLPIRGRPSSMKTDFDAQPQI
ncbi:uncharacterized protein BDV14DRAFT_194800 [Aspergillus stella-maris]|uniref:uncharacterized protein n=1 Tax=Aspergillus stella-maris TaxID=1810926 RepID=UPI003CCD60ED